MDQQLQKQVELTCANSNIRKFKATAIVDLRSTWIEVVQQHFWDCINLDYQDLDKIQMELGLSCNNKLILWTDTVDGAMQKTNYGSRTPMLKVKLRKRSKPVTPNVNHVGINLNAPEDSLLTTESLGSSNEAADVEVGRNQNQAGAVPSCSSAHVHPEDFLEQPNYEIEIKTEAPFVIQNNNTFDFGTAETEPGPSINLENYVVQEVTVISPDRQVFNEMEGTFRARLQMMSSDQLFELYQSWKVLTEVFTGNQMDAE